jgi:hypothetical protein
MTVSIITAAYHNGDVLFDAIKSLEAQTTDDWQHIIVHDGPADNQLWQELSDLGYSTSGKRVFVELGRNWHGFMGGDEGKAPGPGARGGRGSRGAMAGHVGTYFASGEFIGFLDADCKYRPRHVEISQSALRSTGADWTYTQVQRQVDGVVWDIVGNGAPGHGTIDGNGVVARVELFRENNWRWGGDADWDLFERWIKAGAECVFIPMCTVDWYHAGDDI